VIEEKLVRFQESNFPSFLFLKKTIYKLNEKYKININKRDLDMILISQEVDPKSVTVLKAFRSAAIPNVADSITYDDFGKLLLLLDTHFRAGRNQKEFQESCETVLGFMETNNKGAQNGVVDVDQFLELSPSSVKNTLIDSQVKKLTDYLKDDLQGKLNLKNLSNES